MQDKVVLEKSAYEVAKKTSIPPFIYQLPIEEGRKVLEDLQNSPIYKYPTQIDINLLNYTSGPIKVYIVTPQYTKPIDNIIFYIHGAGWVFGSFHTHEKLVRELAFRTNSVVIFPEYTRSPEAQFPVAIQECYYVLEQIPSILKANNINSSHMNLIVAGDSVGGNMAIDMVLLSKYNHGPKIKKLLLYYPVVDDNFETDSYLRFANNYYLTRDEMIWFWDNYEPDIQKRNNILITPLKAALEQLTDFPDTLIINGEADVLRDEGESFAKKLREAGNNVTAVRLQGMIHDFVMLNSLNDSNATRTAMNITVNWID